MLIVFFETNLDTSPPSLWTSLTKLEEIKEWLSEDIKKTVSISGFNWKFMPVICNSYSKSETALKPFIIQFALWFFAKSIKSPLTEWISIFICLKELKNFDKIL